MSFRATSSAAALSSRVAAAGAVKVACFDSLRGIAAMIVVLSHLIVGFWPELEYRNGPQWEALPSSWRALVRFPLSKFWDGSLAVTLFFVLSGFVLSLAYFQKGVMHSLGSAALRRYPRLMIPVGASILLTFVLLKSGAICHAAAVELLHEQKGVVCNAGAPMGATHIWLVQWYDFAPDFRVAVRQSVWDAFTGVATYNAVLWTMPLELMGSFLVYAFLAFFGGMRNRWLLYLIACGTLAARDTALSIPTLAALSFVGGMALCDLHVQNQKVWRRELPFAVALALLCLAPFLIKVKPLAALLMIGAVAASPRLQQLLSTPWLALLGRLSFGIYLLHMAIFCSLGCGVYLLLCRDLGWARQSACLSASAVTVAATLLASWAFYHLVDRPAILFTQWFDACLFKPRAPRAAAAPAAPATSRSLAA